MNKKILIGAVAVISVIAIAFFVMSDDGVQDSAKDIKDDIHNYQKENAIKKENEEKHKRIESEALTFEDFESMTDEEREELNELIEGKLDEAMESIYPRDGLDEIDDDELGRFEGEPELFEEFFLEDIFGEAEVKEAKRIAESFLKGFHNYSGEEPDKYVEASKEYMTSELYLETLQEKRIPYQNQFYIEFKSLEHHTSSHKPNPDDEIPLIYYVEGVHKNMRGEETSVETDFYILEMVKTRDGYKVGDFVKNVPYY